MPVKPDAKSQVDQKRSYAVDIQARNRARRSRIHGRIPVHVSDGFSGTNWLFDVSGASGTHSTPVRPKTDKSPHDEGWSIDD